MEEKLSGLIVVSVFLYAIGNFKLFNIILKIQDCLKRLFRWVRGIVMLNFHR